MAPKNTLLLCSLLILISAPVQAQEAKRPGFLAVSEDVFDVLTQFYSYDTSYPLDARIIETYDEEAYQLEIVVFTNSLDERVPGHLALPTGNGASAKPCVLLLHGLNDSKDKWWDHDIDKHVMEDLLSTGFAVFAIDLRYHGGRAAANDFQRPMYLTFGGNEYFVRSRNMIIQSTIDARRAIDYLETRNDIDKGRIAVLGYSMGGMIAHYLTVLEGDRLAAVVACATPTGKQPLPIDPFQFAFRNTNTPILLLMGKKDWFAGEADAQLLLQTTSARHKELKLYESGHRLPVGYANDAMKWLKARMN